MQGLTGWTILLWGTIDWIWKETERVLKRKKEREKRLVELQSTICLFQEVKWSNEQEPKRSNHALMAVSVLLMHMYLLKSWLNLASGGTGFLVEVRIHKVHMQQEFRNYINFLQFIVFLIIGKFMNWKKMSEQFLPELSDRDKTKQWHDHKEQKYEYI